MINKMECFCKECKIIGGLHSNPPEDYGPSRPRCDIAKRAGVVVCNKEKDTILLVQSRGYKWGFAKGHVEEGETARETAIRELLEETGIHATHFDDYINVFNLAIYYIHELENTPSVVSIGDDDEITGTMWIKLSCLEKLMKDDDTEISSSRIKINSHCKYILTSYFNIYGANVLDTIQ